MRREDLNDGQKIVRDIIAIPVGSLFLFLLLCFLDLISINLPYITDGTFTKLQAVCAYVAIMSVYILYSFIKYIIKLKKEQK